MLFLRDKGRPNHRFLLLEGHKGRENWPGHREIYIQARR